MSSEVLTFTIGPGQTGVGGQGRIWNLLNAPGGPVTLQADTRSQKGGQSPQRIFKNVPPGSKFTAEKGEHWTYLRMDSAVLQTITIFIGDEDLQFNNAVTVTGLATVAVFPSSVITDTAAVALPNAATTQIVAANPTRRRVTICNPSTALGSFFIRPTLAGANNLLEVQPGTFTEFDTTAAIFGRNDSGGALSALVLEET